MQPCTRKASFRDVDFFIIPPNCGMRNPKFKIREENVKELTQCQDKKRGCQAKNPNFPSNTKRVCARRFPKGDRKALWRGVGAEPQAQKSQLFLVKLLYGMFGISQTAPFVVLINRKSRGKPIKAAVRGFGRQVTLRSLTAYFLIASRWGSVGGFQSGEPA